MLWCFKIPCLLWHKKYIPLTSAVFYMDGDPSGNFCVSWMWKELLLSLNKVYRKHIFNRLCPEVLTLASYSPKDSVMLLCADSKIIMKRNNWNFHGIYSFGENSNVVSRVFPLFDMIWTKLFDISAPSFILESGKTLGARLEK